MSMKEKRWDEVEGLGPARWADLHDAVRSPEWEQLRENAIESMGGTGGQKAPSRYTQ